MCSKMLHRDVAGRLLRYSLRMFQCLFSGLVSRRVQATNLLPNGVVITSNKHHRRLLPTEFASVLQPEAYSATERSLRSYPINPATRLLLHRPVELARLPDTRTNPS